MAFTYNDYVESEAVKKKREEAEKYKQYVASQSVNDAKTALDLHEQNKVADWTGGTYGESLKAALDRINNREKFTYDLNGDALYQQYKDQYINQGRMEMQDTMGQAAAMTGGYGNSYAATVGNQAYQGYLQKLNDVVPELYNLALNKYNLEGQELKDQYSLLKDQYNTEYGQYRDKVGDWSSEAARLSDKYYNESSLDYSRFADQRDYTTNEYNTERSYDYGLYSDAYNRAFAQYQNEADQAYRNWQMAMAEKEYALSASKARASSTPTVTTAYDNGNTSAAKIKEMQAYLGIPQTGYWDETSYKAAGGLTADEAFAQYDNTLINDEGKVERGLSGDSSYINNYLSQTPTNQVNKYQYSNGMYEPEYTVLTSAERKEFDDYITNFKYDSARAMLDGLAREGKDVTDYYKILLKESK